MIKIKVLSVRSPVWSERVGGSIDCSVKFNTHEDEMPFTASPDDCEGHGREIYWRCRLGEFGPIGAPLARPKYSDVNNDENGVDGPDWLEKVPGFFEFLREINDEVRRASPRAIILIWGSKLDGLIDQVLKSRDLKVKKDDFYHRIKALADNQLLDARDTSCLHAIRILRNEAAHGWSLSFDYSHEWKEEALERFKVLHGEYDSQAVFFEDLEHLTRGVFGAAAGIIMMKLIELIR